MPANMCTKSYYFPATWIQPLFVLSPTLRSSYFHSSAFVLFIQTNFHKAHSYSWLQNHIILLTLAHVKKSSINFPSFVNFLSSSTYSFICSVITIFIHLIFLFNTFNNCLDLCHINFQTHIPYMVYLIFTAIHSDSQPMIQAWLYLYTFTIPQYHLEHSLSICTY